nr:unnamed protein product [Digitaria exilis]
MKVELEKQRRRQGEVQNKENVPILAPIEPGMAMEERTGSSISTKSREKNGQEEDSVCCPPSLASVAAEAKIRRGVQAPQHKRTSSHAAQAALAIAPPPRLPPPSGPPAGPQQCSQARSLSLSPLLLLSAL